MGYSYADSHYAWLELHLKSFYEKLGIRYSSGVIAADGDKCYDYEDDWKEAGIPFPHGVAIYILSKEKPYCNEVRDTKNGWVNVYKWVIAKYPEFKQFLDPV